MNSLSPPRLRGAALTVLILCSASLPAQTPAVADRGQLERKLVSTSALIEHSSAAQQIAASGNSAALAQLAKARELHARAGQALGAGDLEGASKLLDEASRAMVAGARLASPQQIEDTKQRADFAARLASTRALIEAHKRIAAEKGGPRGAEPSRQAEALVAEGEKLLAAGKVADARMKLDQAYLTVKAAIGIAREGDTLVRSLHFANAAEEYDYEIDRNDTHRMLVQMLLKDRRGVSEAMVDQATAASTRLRLQAEAQASRKDHKAAIGTLEESTRELVKAIRAAGVYIPG